jgi:hypothetical protein
VPRSQAQTPMQAVHVLKHFRDKPWRQPVHAKLKLNEPPGTKTPVCPYIFIYLKRERARDAHFVLSLLFILFILSTFSVFVSSRRLSSLTASLWSYKLLAGWSELYIQTTSGKIGIISIIKTMRLIRLTRITRIIRIIRITLIFE